MKEKRTSKKKVFRRIAICLFLASLPVMFTSCIITAALVLTDIIDETTEEQMDRIRDISGIEEYLITYDDWDFGADGHVYNDYEFYLSDGGFLKAGSLTELLKRYDFYGWCDPIDYAIGPYSVEVQDRSKWPGKCLSFSDLAFFTGKEIIDLQDVVDNYSLIVNKLESEPYIENDNGRFEIKLSPLDKTTLAVRENEFFADLQTMPHIASVKKEKLKVTNQQYYKYEIKMDDGVRFEMTLSTVYRDGDDYICDFFITSYNKKKIKWNSVWDKNDEYAVYRPYASWYHFAKDTGIEVKSYRDLFYNYEAFKKSIENFIMTASE